MPPATPASAVVGVSMSDYAADIAKLCDGLPEPPVLLGHSMGGLVAQLAARRAEIRALVLLAPSPPWGVVGSSLEEAATAFGVQIAGPLLVRRAGARPRPDAHLQPRPDAQGRAARRRSRGCGPKAPWRCARR